MFDKKKSKKQEEFIGLLTKAYSFIKLRKFSEAVALYNKINNNYQKLSQVSKTDKIKKDIARLREELTLYLRINEAYILSEEGNLGKLKEELDSIHRSLYELEDTEETKSLREYVETHYKFFLDIFTYKTSQIHFTQKRRQVLELLEKNKTSESKKAYSELLVIFNKLSEYIDEAEKEKLYASLKEIFRELSVNTLTEKANKKPIKIQPRRLELKSNKAKIHPILKAESHKFSEEYKEMRKLLEKGDFSEAEKRLSKV